MDVKKKHKCENGPTYMVCTPGEVKVNQHKLACDHPERPRTWKMKRCFTDSKLYRYLGIFRKKFYFVLKDAQKKCLLVHK